MAAKTKKKKFRWLWIITLTLIAALFLYNLSKNNLPQSRQEAILKVKALPDVADYLKRVPNALVLVNGEENNVYMVQVYEIRDGHTATFNWYKVDKTTGSIEKQF